MKVLEIKPNYGGYDCHVLLEDGEVKDDQQVIEKVGELCTSHIFEAKVEWQTSREARVSLASR